MRILIVEDDRALGSFLQKGLQMEGYEVFYAADGEEAVTYGLECHPELVILDLGLPRLDGMEVLRCFQQNASETRVLILTGRSGLEVRLDSLNRGADDLLTKPFSFQELLARCKALLRRRAAPGANTVLQHQGLEMRRVERRVQWNGVSVDLTAKEFALLEYLLLHRGRSVSRAELLREVWSAMPDAGTNVVDVYINYVRRKIANACLQDAEMLESAIALIETIRGEGYRISTPAKPPMSVYPPAMSHVAYA